MENEDKIFGLIVQAEDIQRHAVVLQRVAQDAFKTLPDASRSAVSDAAREIIVQGTEKASRGLLDASREAKAAATELRNIQGRAWFVYLFGLCLVAVIIVFGLYFGLGWMIQLRAAELRELKAETQEMQATVDKLNNQYGKALFNTCDGRPCVRVNERLGRYGDVKNGELYMVLFNY